MENDPLLKEEKCKVKELPPRQGCFVLGEIMINWRFRGMFMWDYCLIVFAWMHSFVLYVSFH
jgi:hypothetical protein